MRAEEGEKAVAVLAVLGRCVERWEEAALWVVMAVCEGIGGEARPKRLGLGWTVKWEVGGDRLVQG